MVSKPIWKEGASVSYFEARQRLLQERGHMVEVIKNAQARLMTIEADLSGLRRGAQLFGLTISSDFGEHQTHLFLRTTPLFPLVTSRLIQAYPKPLTISGIWRTLEPDTQQRTSRACLEHFLVHLKAEGLATQRGTNWFASLRLREMEIPETAR